MQVFIGLGSNLESPLQQVTQACYQLQQHPAIELRQVSPWYRSKAVGPEQPDYINGVAALDTSLTPEHLLDALQEIEQKQGRVRSVHWGPRTLDLDILLCGGQIIHTERLQVPHPWMHCRNFVLQPLYDLAPDLILPDGSVLKQLLARAGSADLEQLA